MVEWQEVAIRKATAFADRRLWMSELGDCDWRSKNYDRETAVTTSQNISCVSSCLVLYHESRCCRLGRLRTWSYLGEPCSASYSQRQLKGVIQLLNEHSGHEVHLYEAESRPGGHANTVRYVPLGKDAKDGVDVDTYVPPLLNEEHDLT